MKFVVVGLAAAVFLGACDSDGPKKVTPTAAFEETVTATARASATSAPTATATPDVSKCPVDAATCAVAERFVSAWEAKDVDALMAMATPLPTSCPVPRPMGLGGPYPLCDDATVDGEVREGFVWSSGTHGGLESREELRERLAGAGEADRPLLTIGCDVVEGTNQCGGNFLLSFGTFPFGGDLETVASLPVLHSDGATGLLGVLPVFVSDCTVAPANFACERVIGGKGSDPGYWYWGDESQIPRPPPEWVYFRWTP